MAVEIWADVVGPLISRNTMALRFSNGVLHVRTRSPQWTQELHFHEPRIIARLNGRLQRNLVTKIRATVTTPRGVKAGALKAGWEDPTFPDLPQERPAPAPPLNDAAAQRARVLSREIEDDALREVMERLIATAIRAGDTRTGSPRTGDTRTGDTRAGNARTSDTRTGRGRATPERARPARDRA
jgi:hypothetical protein